MIYVWHSNPCLLLQVFIDLFPSTRQTPSPLDLVFVDRLVGLRLRSHGLVFHQ